MPQVIVASAKASFSLLQAALAAATTAGVDTAAAHVQWAQLKEQATKHTLEQALSVSNAIADSNAAIEAGGAPVVMGARVRVKPSVTEPKCVAQAPLKAPACTRLFPTATARVQACLCALPDHTHACTIAGMVSCQQV